MLHVSTAEQTRGRPGLENKAIPAALTPAERGGPGESCRATTTAGVKGEGKKVLGSVSNN